MGDPGDKRINNHRRLVPSPIIARLADPGRIDLCFQRSDPLGLTLTSAEGSGPGIILALGDGMECFFGFSITGDLGCPRCRFMQKKQPGWDGQIIQIHLGAAEPSQHLIGNTHVIQKPLKIGTLAGGGGGGDLER